MDKFGPLSYNLDDSKARDKVFSSSTKENKNEYEQELISSATKYGSENLQTLFDSREEEDLEEEGYASRDLRRSERLIARQGRKTDRILGRIDKASGNVNKTERLTKRLEKNRDKFDSKMASGAGAGADWGGGAMATAAALPGIIDTFSSTPTTKGEANANIAKSAMDFASIGGSIVPGWGHLIGAAVGAGAGYVGNGDWFNEGVESADQQVVAQQKIGVQSRMDNYMNNKSLEQLGAEKDIYSKSLGYSNRSFNS